MLRYEWRGPFNCLEANDLHAECLAHDLLTVNWWTQVNEHSLGWVCARQDGGLVGFVNVAWDGDVHAFLLDTSVAARTRRQGIGTHLVTVARERARAAGCEWLHVDFEQRLRTFYFGACQFGPSDAGLIAL
jgi:GNAT superfamily N-acetyltransferase